MGHTLAVGDWRALLGQQVGEHELGEVETTARTGILGQEQPLAVQATAIGIAMRRKYPVPQDAVQGWSWAASGVVTEVDRDLIGTAGSRLVSSSRIPDTGSRTVLKISNGHCPAGTSTDKTFPWQGKD